MSEYAIFLDEETNILFDDQKDLIPQSVEIVKKWWKFMSDIMEVNEDNSPVTVALEEVFYLD